MAGIALLLLSGIISLLMLIGHTIYPVVLNILFLLTVVGSAPTVDTSPGAAEKGSVPPLPEGSWRFIVSGDSRNCGDIVMPAIASHSARFTPNFYWHLGDLRATYKIDEDMAFEAQYQGHPLTCDVYERLAWNDYSEHQIAAFGNLPFYVGIGNHEVIPPKTEAAFKRQFNDWLDVPVLHDQRLQDKEPPQPEPYYHWIQGGVDFISLDNATNAFSDGQIAWLARRLDSAKTNSEVKSVVVGMHEALPDSIANYHSMGDNPAARPSGIKVYKALVEFSRPEPQAGLCACQPFALLYGKYFRHTRAEGERRETTSRMDCGNRWSCALQTAQWRSVHSETRRLWILAGHSRSRRHDSVFV